MGGRISILAKRLEEALKKADISQKTLGIRAGIDEFIASTSINQYVRGTHTPKLQTMTRVAAVLQVPLPWFYCEDAELAEVIIKFSALPQAQRRRFLGLLQDL
jgi:transcriptional regulator with XRE-family HTH domain